MLLRAYIIRLADGLVASGARTSVVTDIHRRFPIRFAGAKIGVFVLPDCHGDITVTKIKSGALHQCHRFRGTFGASGSGNLAGREIRRSFAPSIGTDGTHSALHNGCTDGWCTGAPDYLTAGVTKCMTDGRDAERTD